MSSYGVVRRHIGDGAVSPMKLHTALRDGSYVYEKFNIPPVVQSAVSAGVPTGTTGAINYATFNNGLFAQYVILGVGQTIFVPPLATAGLRVDGDQTDNEGFEYNFGFIQASPLASPLVVKARASADRFYRLKFTCATPAGTDFMAFGLRKAQALQTALASYTDYAVLNVDGGDIFTETNLNGAGAVTTDTGVNWGAGEQHELKLILRNDGNVENYVDGIRYQPATQFRFDDQDIIVPFWFFLHDAALAGVVTWQEFEAGNIEDVDDSKIL